MAENEKEGSMEMTFGDRIKKLFSDIDTSNPRAIIDLINQFSSKAAVTLEREISQKESLEKEVDELSDKAQKLKEDRDMYRDKYERELERVRDGEFTDFDLAFVNNVIQVRDDIQRAIAQDQEELPKQSVALIAEKFDKILEHKGIKQINPAQGEQIDPHKHEVISTVDDDEISDGNIINCTRRGYKIDDDIIREARVVAAKSE